MKLRGIAVVTLVAAGALLAGGGIAVAGSGHGGGTAAGDRCQRFVEMIAERQGISVAALEAKWKQKAIERIDAALTAGRITKQQADRLKARVTEWKLCDGSLRKAAAKARQAMRLHGAAIASMISGAIDYLDVSRAELRAAWRDGKSLADVAGANGKSVTGLKTAMLAKIDARLDRAVTNGKLTDERRDALLERYGKLADRLIAKKLQTKSS
jgi:hypothetical protein